MTGIFKANNPSNNFLLLLYGFVLKLPLFLHPSVPHYEMLDGFLYKALLQWIAPAGAKIPLIYGVITFFLLYIQAISINTFVNSQRLMQKNNHLPGMCYLLMTSLFADWYQLSSSIVINTLLIWVLSKLTNLHTNNSPKSSLFNAGIIIGIATFFYFPSIAFLLLIIVGLGITRPFRLPEWLMVLLGLLTPYYFLGAWLFLSGNWKGYRIPGISVTRPVFNQSGWAYTAIIFIFLTVIIGIYFIQDNMRRQVVQVRKSWNILFLYLLVALFIPFLNHSHRFDYWILAAVPVSIISGAAFLYPERKLVPGILHWGMVAVSLVVNYYLK